MRPTTQRRVAPRQAAIRGRFTMDLDTANGMTRYRLLDGGVVVRSGWVSDAGMLSAEFERFCGERTL